MSWFGNIGTSYKATIHTRVTLDCSSFRIRSFSLTSWTLLDGSSTALPDKLYSFRLSVHLS